MNIAENTVTVVEILIAELIFLYYQEKRSHFILRYVLAWGIALGMAALLPLTAQIGNNYYLSFLRIILRLALTIAVMVIPFKTEAVSLISACIAGQAVQHIAYQSKLLLLRAPALAHLNDGSISFLMVDFAVFPAIYLIFLLTLGRRAARTHHTKTMSQFSLVPPIIFFVSLAINFASRVIGDSDSISLDLYSIFCCLLALIIQFVLYQNADLRMENATIHLLWQKNKKQYELSKKTIDAFNIKYHDLKHKLNNLHGRLPEEEIESLRESARMYGSRVKTGDDALDVLLTENSLRCTEEGIRIQYMGNGADLSFMNLMDVYSLFGNALENAIEAVRKVDDPEKKLIHITTERMGDMISVDITNYFFGKIEYEDGLPMTTKSEEGFHGFGIKSMKFIAEKYGGSISVETEGELFSLGIYLMASTK